MSLPYEMVQSVMTTYEWFAAKAEKEIASHDAAAKKAAEDRRTKLIKDREDRNKAAAMAAESANDVEVKCDMDGMVQDAYMVMATQKVRVVAVTINARPNAVGAASGSFPVLNVSPSGGDPYRISLPSMKGWRINSLTFKKNVIMVGVEKA